jgi:hypothetical protein
MADHADAAYQRIKALEEELQRLQFLLRQMRDDLEVILRGDGPYTVWCPISNELAEQMRRPEGLTTTRPVTMRLDGDGLITVTEHSA